MPYDFNIRTGSPSRRTPRRAPVSGRGYPSLPQPPVGRIRTPTVIAPRSVSGIAPRVARVASGLVNLSPGGQPQRSPAQQLVKLTSPSLTPGQQVFGSLLAKYTGLDPRVIGGWMLAEESSGPAQSREAQGNHNWLNIGYFDSGPGAITASRAFANPQTAAKQTAAFLRGKWGGASPGIQSILASVKKPPSAQIGAIANSGWASSGYGGGRTIAQLASTMTTKKGRLPGGSPYAYPFSKGIQIGRTDMGIDPYGSGAIRTIGKARYLGQGGAGWPAEGGSGVGPVYKLLGGPMKGKRVYTYEGITPANLRPGQKLRRGQVIARSTGSSFETGFAQGRGAGFQPLASSHYSEGDVTPEGQAFRKFVGGIKNRSGLGSFGPLGSFSPAAAGVAQAAGVPVAQAQTALGQARQQNRPKPAALVSLTPPNTVSGVPFPQALADLFGGVLPQLGGGGTGGNATGLSTQDLATMLAQLAARPQTPLSSLRRRRSASYR